jgi:Tfp pilus assembly protein PilX
MRTNQTTNLKIRRKQRGVALLIVIFALLLVSGIAIAMLGNANTETAINQNYRETQQAYFAAQGGISEAIDRLKIGAGTNGITGPTALPVSASANVIYIINKKSATETVTPWDMTSNYADTEFCKENFGISGVTNNGTGAPCTTAPSGSSWYTTYNSISPFTGTSAALDYKWVRITLKSNSTNYPYYTNNSNASATLSSQVCGDGNGGEVVISSGTCSSAGYYPVYVLTSLAVTARGTRRMTQREITNIRLPPFPGALTLDGPAPASGGVGFIPPFDAPNSNVFHVNGNNASGCPGAGKPAIAVPDVVTQTDVTTQIPTNRYGNYTGSGSTTPDVETVSSSTLGNWSTVSGVQAVSSMLATAAGSNYYTGPQTDINIGTTSNPQVTYVNGDLTLTGNTTGAGILVVTGTLTISGTGGFQGIILVIGKGNFVYKGGGSAEFDGAVLVAQTLDSAGHTLSTLGEPVVDWSGGGGNGIFYNTCQINNVQNGIGFQTQSTRELGY